MRIRGWGELVAAGGRAVMSVNRGGGDGDVCDNGDEEVKEANDDNVASD